MNITLIKEGWRIFKRSRYVKKHGVKQYSGTAKEICNKIIEDCWNGSYYQVSNGHFSEFYMRDFGWCVDSLLKLGKRDRVLKTLDYALDHYSKQKLTTTINSKGKCIDVFSYAPDSLAFLVRSLVKAKANDLIRKYKSFLFNEIKKFEKIIDPKTGMVDFKKYSSMKDQSIRKSSTYDNCMAAMLAKDIRTLGLHTTLNFDNLKSKIKEELWNGNHFYDDMQKKEDITGDANLFPFWTGVFTDKKMMASAFNSIHKAGLDKPFPLKYSIQDDKKKNFVSLFSSNYEGSSLWMHMGLLYVQMMKKVDMKKHKEYLKTYTGLIKQHKNFLEVYNFDGTPFKSSFYYSDESMLWCVNYLTMIS